MNSEDQTVQPGAGHASAKLRKIDEGWEVWVFNPVQYRARWKRIGPTYISRLHAEDRARLFLAHSAVAFYSRQAKLNK